MGNVRDPLRAQLLRFLNWEEAHVGFDMAVGDIPADKRGARAQGFEHSPWQLLEHMRIAQKLTWPDRLLAVSRTYVHDF